MKARYKFERNLNLPHGFLSQNSVATDALNALSAWSAANIQRNFLIITEDDDELVADLEWQESGESVISELSKACNAHAVERSYQQL